MKRRTTGTILAASAMALVLLGGCSDDDDSAETSDTTVTTLAGSGVDATTVAFCDAYAEGNSYFGSLEGPPDQAKADDILGRVTDNAPDELTEPVATVVESTNTMLAGGGESEGPDEAMMAADSEIGVWMADNCGWESIESTATDYEFSGIPETVPAGDTIIGLANDGAEFHEIAIMRINDGVTQSADEILALPQAEAEALVAQVGIAFAAPGETGYATANLEPGKYIVACFIPQGMTPVAMAAMETGGAEPEGQPHFMLGMATEFTVE